MWVTEIETMVTKITVQIQKERRAPGGSRAFRWERVAPTTEDFDAVFDRIADQFDRHPALHQSPKESGQP